MPHILVYDDGDLAHPFREVARFEHGARGFSVARRPRWLKNVR